MREAFLVLNAGSSSIKFLLFAVAGRDRLEPLIRGHIEGIHTSPHFIARGPEGKTIVERHWGESVELGHDGAVAWLGDFIRSEAKGLRLEAVGHRVVHGGPTFVEPVAIDRDVLAALERLIPLAPLHQPHNLAPVRMLLDRQPELPQVACFDTAFHSTNPDVARRFAIPQELHDAGVRRYGFHGLSYEFIASILPECYPRVAARRAIVCHLGNGSSLCALEDGRSVATTMGFTALDGLPMGTRCGAIDPGVLLYLMDELKFDARAIERLLYQRSGLLGVSGISSDMRALLASPAPSARLAIDLFVYRVGRELGSLAAALGGLDALIFTGGIGENSTVIREGICRGAAWLGVELDDAANQAGGPCISTASSRVCAWVMPTNEELMIARHTQRLVASQVPAHH